MLSLFCCWETRLRESNEQIYYSPFSAFDLQLQIRIYFDAYLPGMLL